MKCTELIYELTDVHYTGTHTFTYIKYYYTVDYDLDIILFLALNTIQQSQHKNLNTYWMDFC